jgi:hypothetical protein
MHASPPKGLRIVEQKLPGAYELAEEDPGKVGLPDAWIHDDQNWSLLIESKIAAPLKVEQLKRHYRTALNRGYQKITVLAIDVYEPKEDLPNYVVFRTWRQIYSWLVRQSKSSKWARRTLEYFEVSERKLPAQGYLKEGTLTEFSGIHFDENEPYNYPEGKRLIKLMMDSLRQQPDLSGLINSRAKGRGAITGKRRETVWDYLRLKGLDSEVSHTRVPHLSLVVDRESLKAFIAVPNSMEARYRRRLTEMGEDGFVTLMSLVNGNTRKIIRRYSGAFPYANMTQRRYASQKAKPTVDARMDFDLRTAFPDGKRQKVKHQDQWLHALYDIYCEKRSNIEWSVGVAFPYEKCAKTQSPEILDAIAESWLACVPLIDAIKGRRK